MNEIFLFSTLKKDTCEFMLKDIEANIHKLSLIK